MDQIPVRESREQEKSSDWDIYFTPVYACAYASGMKWDIGLQRNKGNNYKLLTINRFINCH